MKIFTRSWQVNLKNFEQRFTQVFEEVKEKFPVPSYMDEIVFYQTSFILKNILRLSQQGRPNLKLLDIGCGPMEKTAIFSKFGIECFGADDLSDPWHREGDNLDAIIRFANQSSINFHLQKTTDYSIPFERESFDIVVAIEVVEHLHSSPKMFIETAKSFLRPGGLLVLTTPNAVNLRKRISVLFGKTNYPKVNDFYFSGETWRGHVREYTLEELVWCVDQAGLDVVLQDTYEPFAGKKLSGLSKSLYIALGNLNKYFRSGLLVVGKK